MDQAQVLKSRYSLVGKCLIAIILKVKPHQTQILNESFNKLKKDHSLLDYSFEELETEFNGLTGEVMVDVLAVGGNDLSSENEPVKLTRDISFFADYIINCYHVNHVVIGQLLSSKMPKQKSRTRRKAAPQNLVEDVQHLVEEQSQELPPIYRPPVQGRKARQAVPETNTEQPSIRTADDICL
ncbi:unnamed protein product [Mytilus edulis]|uniref:Uncharacterized protein n=1 Tax=Mytilus edulis TaxID=6550 RepID=A0A8S3TER6_MYTED|nr:unnamed protein product [Mytilus edulis]